jgi:hypothetical protein
MLQLMDLLLQQKVQFFITIQMVWPLYQRVPSVQQQQPPPRQEEEVVV